MYHIALSIDFFNISYYFSRGIRKTTYVGYGAPPISIVIIIIFCNTCIHNNIHVIGLGNKLLVSCLVSCISGSTLLYSRKSLDRYANRAKCMAEPLDFEGGGLGLSVWPEYFGLLLGPEYFFQKSLREFLLPYSVDTQNISAVLPLLLHHKLSMKYPTHTLS